MNPRNMHQMRLGAGGSFRDLAKSLVRFMLGAVLLRHVTRRQARTVEKITTPDSQPRAGNKGQPVFV